MKKVIMTVLMMSSLALTGCKSLQDYWSDMKNDQDQKQQVEQPKQQASQDQKAMPKEQKTSEKSQYKY